MKTISLQELENSKVYISAVETYKFLHPMDYVQRFMDILQPLNPEWIINVEKEVENGEKGSDVVYTSYGRFALKAKLPDIHTIKLDANIDHNSMTPEIGIVLALDTRKPEMKVASGKRVDVCTNQCIFGSNNVTSILLTSNRETIYERTKVYADRLEQEVNEYKQAAERLYNNKHTTWSSINERVGEIFWKAKESNELGITVASKALGLLQNPQSRYYVDGQTNDWIIYNSLTEAIKDSSIIDEPTKVLFLQNIFNPN